MASVAVVGPGAIGGTIAAWLSRHYTKLGKRSSLNVRDAFY